MLLESLQIQMVWMGIAPNFSELSTEKWLVFKLIAEIQDLQKSLIAEKWPKI